MQKLTCGLGHACHMQELTRTIYDVLFTERDQLPSAESMYPLQGTNGGKGIATLAATLHVTDSPYLVTRPHPSSQECWAALLMW